MELGPSPRSTGPSSPVSPSARPIHRLARLRSAEGDPSPAAIRIRPSSSSAPPLPRRPAGAGREIDPDFESSCLFLLLVRRGQASLARTLFRSSCRLSPLAPHAKLAAGSGAGHFVRSTVRNEFVAAGLGLLLSVDFSCSFGRSMACLIFLKICHLQGTMRRLVSTALVARGLVRSCRASTAAVRLANPSVGGFHSCYLSETV